MLDFKTAKNTLNGVLVDNKTLSDILSITGNKTSSEGLVLANKNNMIYIPNYTQDTKKIVEEVGNAFVKLAAVPPIMGSGQTTAINPDFALKLQEMGNSILKLIKDLV